MKEIPIGHTIGDVSHPPSFRQLDADFVCALAQKRVHLVALVIMCLVVLRNARGIPLRAYFLPVDLCFVNASCCGKKGGFLNLFVLYLEAASQRGKSAVAGVGKKELRLLASDATGLLLGI